MVFEWSTGRVRSTLGMNSVFKHNETTPCKHITYSTSVQDTVNIVNT